MSKIKDLLNFDALNKAEEITGKELDDEVTAGLGFTLFCTNNMLKEKHLKSVGDTYFKMSWREFEELVKKLGFEEVYSEVACFNDFFDNQPTKEIFKCWMRKKDGVLIQAETYGYGKKGDQCAINSGILNCEYKVPKTASTIFIDHFSGGSHKNSEDYFECHGNCDIREGMVYNLSQVNKYEMIPIWTQPDKFLWLCGYWETKNEGYNYRELTKAKIKNFPDWAKEIMKNSL